MKYKVKISIPENIKFSDLQLTHNPLTGNLKFNWTPLEQLCVNSNIDISIFKDQSEDNVAALILNWYTAHLDAGGEKDIVAESLITKVKIEDILKEIK